MEKAIKRFSPSPFLTDDQKVEFATRLETYRAGVEKIHADYWKGQGYTHNAGSVARIEEGQRFVKIMMIEQAWVDHNDHSKGIRGDAYWDGGRAGGGRVKSQIHSFIDKLTGDVLKPAGYKAPAKHARGNIYDAHNGLSMVNHFGPNYLR